MRKKKVERIKPRLHPDTIDALRHKGGAHSSRKGKRGYNRKRANAQWKKQLDNSNCF